MAEYAVSDQSQHRTVMYRRGCLDAVEQVARHARRLPTKQAIVHYLDTVGAAMATGMQDPIEIPGPGLSFTFTPDNPALGGRWTVKQGDDGLTWTITSPEGVMETFEAAEVSDVMAWMGGVLMGVQFAQRRTPPEEPPC